MELSDETGEGKLSTINGEEASMVSSVIGEDGVMVLKLVGANSSELLVKDVVCGISRIARTGTVATSGQLMQQPPMAGLYPNAATAKVVP